MAVVVAAAAMVVVAAAAANAAEAVNPAAAAAKVAAKANAAAAAAKVAVAGAKAACSLRQYRELMSAAERGGYGRCADKGRQARAGHFEPLDLFLLLDFLRIVIFIAVCVEMFPGV